MFKYLRYAVCLLAVVAFAACGDDDKIDTPDDPGQKDDVTTESMTPEESKVFLESVAKEVLNMFNPDDQEATIEFLNNFSEAYGDLEAPENWDDDYDMSPSYVSRNLRSALSRADFTGMSRAFYTYTWNFDRLRGVYEPRGYRWVKTTDSEDVIFRCIVNGQSTEFKAVASGSNEVINVVDDDNSEQWIVTLPKEITFTATQGNTTHIAATVKASFKENVSLDLSVNAQVANLKAEAVLSATNTQINESTKGYVSGALLVTATAQVNGANMCNRSEIKRIIDANSESNRNKLLGNMFQKGVANVDVLGKVQVKASVSGLDKLLETETCFETPYDYATKSECLKACQSACEVFNTYVTGKMYYNGSSSLQGEIVFAPSRFYSWGSSSGEYEVETLIQFADKTTYSLDEYFNEKDFSGVTKLWDRLVNSYEDLWD